MEIDSRILSFCQLGNKLKIFMEQPDYSFLNKVNHTNQWFIPEFVLSSINGIQLFLQKKNLENWINKYELSSELSPKTIGIIMAGNIPLVGFHDLLCVLLSGHRALIKTSHLDDILIKWIIKELIKINPEFKQLVCTTNKIEHADAIIATGSDNSARYFKFYYNNSPRIIRHNRSSIAILNGNETEKQLEGLADDVFMYFGLGCRNVSKIFIPQGYEIDNIIRATRKYTYFKQHKGYINNYDQQKAISKLSGDSYIDADFYLIKEAKIFIAPISVVYYEEYNSSEHLQNLMEPINDKIQCLVSIDFPGSLYPGKAQFPEVWDYSDNVDTLDFLNKL